MVLLTSENLHNFTASFAFVDVSGMQITNFAFLMSFSCGWEKINCSNENHNVFLISTKYLMISLYFLPLENGTYIANYLPTDGICIKCNITSACEGTKIECCVHGYEGKVVISRKYVDAIAVFKPKICKDSGKSKYK